MVRSGEILKKKGGVVLNGNEAVARGALEAGVNVATSYPGTPATEILAALAEVSDRTGVYTEWSVNEAVAFELAMGASYANLRAMCSMKHLGENTIIDALNVVNYTGVNGGLVLVVADDPKPIASQNALDSRYHAITAKIPCLEPANGQEAKEMVKYAFKLSEDISLPVQIRLTSKISHTNYVIELGRLRAKKKTPSFKRQPHRFVCIPSHSRELHRELNRKNEILRRIFEKSGNNRLEKSKSDFGIIASGFAYNYVKEAIVRTKTKASILKLSTVNPIPPELIKRLLKRTSKVLVAEEVEPIVEAKVRELAFEIGYKGEIFGKKTGHIPLESELSVESIEDAVLAILNKKKSAREKIEVKRRIPSLCIGCTHRAFYYSLRKALEFFGDDYVVLGDRGCYNVGAHPPLNAIDTCLCMGASIPVASGLSKAGYKGNVVAVIGDSTFLHSGLTGLINSVHNQSNLTVLILDNNWTAMTGHQPNPSTRVDAATNHKPRIDIIKLVKACDVGFCEKADPYDIKGSIDVLKKAVKFDGVSVVVFERPCTLKSRYHGTAVYNVNPDRCTGCLICVETFGCPAIVRGDITPRIDDNLCVKCGVCVHVCPVGAIESK
ncbi:MAG: indolepyruvate ferredoxin oxidoreductase subunit alpha [Candidatus Altiarchaeota archaeon]